MKKHIKFAAGILAVCTAAVSLSGCYFFPEEEKLLDPPILKVEDVTYSTYKAVRKTIVNRAVATGYLVSQMSQDCVFTAQDGNIKTVYVKAGDTVKEGDLIAEYNIGDLEYDLRNQELAVDRAQLTYNATGSENDRLQLEIEKNTLEKYRAQYEGSKLYAPCDGLVSFAERLKPGTPVKAYKVIATIIDPTKLYVSATVTDDRKFTKGQDVTITIGEDEYDAVIVKTPKEAKEEGDEVTNLIYADFKGGLPGFTSVGQVADVSYIKGYEENAIVVPKYLVKSLDGKSYVQVFKDGEKKEVEITIGVTNATEVQILTGVSEGDEVVVK